MLKTYVTIFGCLLSSSLLAATVTSTPSIHPYFVGVSAGPTWISGNKTQTINLEPDVVKTYTAQNQDTTFTTAELFLGWQKLLSANNHTFIGQVGLSLVGSGNAKLGGQIWEDGDPTFNNFNYTYTVNHFHTALKGRLVALVTPLFNPYVSASAGVGFNHAYGFTIKPNLSAEVPAPAFRSNTTTAFTYTLGIGLQASLTQDIAAAIGYEFADWGRVQLSKAPGQTTNQRPTLNHLYGHELQFSLTYTV